MRLKTALFFLACLLGIIGYHWYNDYSTTSEIRHRPIIGILNLASYYPETIQGFKDGLTEYSYHENQNIFYRDIEPKSLTNTVLSSVLPSGKKVDIIYLIAEQVPNGIQNILRKNHTPIIFNQVTQPVRDGLVNSLVHPGKNFTGIQGEEFVSILLRYYQILFPHRKNLLVVHDPQHIFSQLALSRLSKTARKEGIRLYIKSYQDFQTVQAILRYMPSNINGIFLIPSPSLIPYAKKLGKAAKERKVAFFSTHHFLKEGAVLTLQPQLYQSGVQASKFAYSVLQGTSPSILPVKQSSYELGLNLRLAKAMRWKIPQSLLEKATRILN